MKIKTLQTKRALRNVLLILLLGVVGLTNSYAQIQGALNGVFSVSENTQVHFSQGNLQYQASTDTWRFADNQWDYVGSDNANISETYSGWIDLFGWGISGYNGKNPYMTSTTSSDYGNGDADIAGTHYDWGVHNAISNGGGQAGLWRTLTKDEWVYMLNTRSTASGIRYANAIVNGVNGVILLPDDWSASYYSLGSTNTPGPSYSSNTISANQWPTLEQHGAVFLPAAGGRNGTSVYAMGSSGLYWSASFYNSYGAGGVLLYNTFLYSDFSNDRYIGQSVRLVCPAENYSFGINALPSPAEGGGVSGGGAYEEGAICTLIATANESYTFINWTENGEVVSTENPYTFTVTGNRNLVANFAASGDTGEYVDLGLPSGLLWAACNVGADTPEAYGDYFAWGETQPKDYYDWSTYQYCNGSYRTLTKYCNRSNYGYNGFTDTLTILLPEDDAATANLGAEWHTPTSEEWQELYNNTTHTWTTQNGVYGLRFIASNGNSLFLPAAGGRYGNGLSDAGSYGDYWASSLYTNLSYNAEGFDFSSAECRMYYENRGYGLSVRAVRFAPLFLVTATANPSEGGTVSGGDSYTVGSTCTLTAAANEGYSFVNWTENGEVVSTDTTYNFIVNADRTLVANFTYNGGGGAPIGAINGVFSVGESSQVLFSQGNLQYQASTDTWRFATNQYDYIGDANSNISQTYSGWIDLFGWGTSGWHDSSDPYNVNYHPYSTSSSSVNTTYNYYGYGPSTNMASPNLTGSSANYDWGVYNAISNGGNLMGQWRTLTYPEWKYIFNQRNTASGMRYAMAQVDGVNGVILLPDNWKANYYSLSNYNNSVANYSDNVVNLSSWTNSLEAHGAVFLPAAGFRSRSSVYYVGSYGHYWSATYSGSSIGYADFVQIHDGSLRTDVCYGEYSGQSVRLVCPAENYSFGINAIPSPSEGGAVIGGGSYVVGATCTLTATANEGYTFIDWTENGEVVSTDTTYSFTVNADRVLVANFTYNGGGTGVLNGYFSVGSGQQVQFSQGNLQYIGSASTPYWKFADRQWYFFGDNGQGSDSPNVDRDLFGWGTSGYNHGAVCYQPWSTSENYQDYYVYGSWRNCLHSQTGQADWGYNAITNGGNIENRWRTLTKDEWNYLFHSRTNASSKWGQGKVNGIEGMIILPDEWALPNGLSFVSGNSIWANVYTIDQWSLMESNGAVFLPAAGRRSGTSVNTSAYGSYWSACAHSGGSTVFYFLFNNANNAIYTLYRYYGFSVRLVCAAGSFSSYTINAIPSPAEGGTVTGGGNYTEGATCTLTAIPNGDYTFINWTEDGEVVSTENPYTFTVMGNRNLVANFASYNPPSPGELQVFTEYYPDSTNVYSPYVKVYWTGIMAGRYNVYRANCDGTNVTLIAENVADTLFIDQSWFNLLTGNYKYGVSMVNGWGSRGEIQWNDTPVAIEEIIIDASDFGNPSANNGNPERSSRESYDNGWLHYDNGNCIKSIGSGLGMFYWGVKFPSETLASYAGNQLKKVAVYVRSGNDGNLNLRVHTGGTTAPGTLVCSMAFDVSGYNNEFVEIMLPEPILITGTENLWITLSQAGNCPAQASPESGEANGRWMSLNGQTWMDMASYGLDGTWMIRACVGNDIYWSNCIDKTHYSIAATANPIEGGTVTGEGMYLQGSTCTLTATATSGYHFANWTENGVVVSTSASYTFTVTRSRNLVANFTTNPQVCAISVSANPSYGGTVAGAGIYYYGTRCTVTALNNSGYAFTNWTENGTVVSINASYTFTVTGGRNLVANFTIVPQVGTIIASANPSYSGTVTDAGTYSNGTNCTLTATANNGYFFLNWTESGTVVSTNPSYTFIVTGNRSLVANFTTNLHYYGINAMPNPAEGGTVTGTGIYMEGQICTLKAYNASGYSFTNWTKDGVVVSTDANYSFLVTENANYVANFEMNNYRITVTANPPTAGAVTGAGTFYYGMNCTVTATANVGYYFAYWTVNGRVVSTSANYTFTVTGNRNLVANFATNPQIYTISVFGNPSYGGTISGAGDYYSGTYCTLTVTANSGYAFTNWTENGTVVSTDSNYTFTVSGDRNLAANFTPVGLISASANPSNAGTITGAGSYRFGTSCTLTATAKSGYLFVNWTENGITVSSDARYTFIVMGNRNLVANFVVNPQVYTISVFSNPSYGGTVAGGGTFLYGENCTVNATPISGYTFVNWTENGTVVSYSTEYVFTVTGNRTLLANFIKATNPQVCTISVSVNPSNGGTALGAGNYYNGTSCILKAIANNGYTFVNWTENGTVVSSNANYTFTVAGNRNLVANFTANLAYYNIIATPNPIAGGTVAGAGNYMEGQSCTLLATANSGYTFVNWTENGAVVSFDADYSFIVTGNRNLVANFTNVAFIGINANPNPIDGGSLTGAGIYIAGQTCTLTATANNDYAFINWTENGTVVSNEASYSFTVTRYRNLVANYAIFGFRFVKPGTWSNAFNWLGHTLPSSEDEAFIDAPCQLNQNATVAALSITEGQTLTVQSDKTLTVTGDLTSTLPSGLVIEDGAQLVHESEGVMATVKRYIVGYDSLVRGRFSVISNPLIAGVDPEDISTHLTSGNYDLYDWLAGSPDSLEWRNYKFEGGRFNLEAGRGYLYANQDDMELSFSGALRPSNNAFGKAVNHIVGEDFHFNGWNLIGNPFVCNVYLVNENGEPLPYYRMNAKGRDFEAVASGVIVPVEGIFYEASESGMVYFTRTAPVQNGGGLKINLTSGTSTSSGTLDNAIIRFGEGKNLKKFNFCEGGSKLYIPQGGKDYAILCVDNTCDSIELCFSNKQSGDFTLTVKATNTEFEYLQLNDHVTGTIVDLLRQPTYTFHAIGQEQSTRFTLVFKKK